MTDSYDVWCPESFRGRPYAEHHFAQIVRYATEHHPFYRAFIPDPTHGVPILTRDYVADNNEALLGGHTPTGQTSGSTGVPVSIAWSPEKSQSEGQANRFLQQIMGGPRNRVRLVSTREGLGSADFLDICRPLPEQIRFIQSKHQSEGITTIVTYPTNLESLAHYLVDQAVELPYVERIVCYAEPFENALRPLIKKAFPAARVWATYSSSELGMIAFTCPENPNMLHTMGKNIGIEVLNKEEQPSEAGEAGLIVATDYVNRYSSFIRYAIGDLAIPGVCNCGKVKTPALSAVLGKVRGSLRRESGEPIMFANVPAELKKIRGLRQYQVIQEEIQLLRFRYIATPEANHNELHSLVRKNLWQFLGFKPTILFEQIEHIYREHNGKFHITICRV